MFSIVHEQKDHTEDDLRWLRECRWQGFVSGNQKRIVNHLSARGTLITF